ncbi:hypothetical protein HMPREF2531_04782 [Bacteroides intestinalis]|uniref:Uncharacterized protein n=2 Tax=Bacteroides TaxID=816 RepID=A0A139KSS2_9BACE|nr:hypothetical protein BACCELL_01633 [Bacteroides cellulosilyticus DSM 14838]KXT42196.1 hypothetical protein HMPREF2531_04782 [Bacteroides intestinalis]
MFIGCFLWLCLSKCIFLGVCRTNFDFCFHSEGVYLHTNFKSIIKYHE